MHFTYVVLHEVTWLYGVHRMHRDSSSFMWHQPCQRCKYTTSVDIQKHAIKKLVTCAKSCEHSESAREQKIVLYKSDQQQQLLWPFALKSGKQTGKVLLFFNLFLPDYTSLIYSSWLAGTPIPVLFDGLSSVVLSKCTMQRDITLKKDEGYKTISI